MAFMAARVARANRAWRAKMFSRPSLRIILKDCASPRIKEIAGVVTGQRKLEAEGKAQELAGKAREKVGQIEKVLGK